MKYSFIIPVHSHSIEHFYKFLKYDNVELIYILTKKRFIRNKNRVKIIEMINAGYGMAINAGVKMADGDYLIICNDDIFPDNDFIVNLQKETNNIIVPIVFTVSGKIESVGSYLNKFYYAVHNKNAKIERQEKLITGSIFIIKKHVFINNGCFDEDYFMYYEDIDFSMKRGIYGNIVISNKLTAIHKHSFSASRVKRYFLQRNRILFLIKHINRFGIFKIINLIMLDYGVMFLQIFLHKSIFPIQARIDAMKLMRIFYKKGKYENIH